MRIRPTTTTRVASAIATVLAAAIAAPGLAAPSHASGMLDGKAFAGESGEQGKAADSKDTLVFHDGKLHSTACDAYGFDEGAYTAQARAGATEFTATTVSPKEGRIEWKGTVRSGDRIDGTFTWTRARQKPIAYWFQGTLQK